LNIFMKKDSDASCQLCSYCGSTRLEVDEDIVKCLDCGMGKYKKDRNKKS
jgi:ribosomal protein L37E